MCKVNSKNRTFKILKMIPGEVPSIQEEEMSGHYSKPYELLNLSKIQPPQQQQQQQQPSGSERLPSDSPKEMSEESKMDLYSKVNKRRSPPVNNNNSNSNNNSNNSNNSEKQDVVETICSTALTQSTTSSSSGGSPPPLETIAPSRRIR